MYACSVTVVISGIGASRFLSFKRCNGITDCTDADPPVCGFNGDLNPPYKSFANKCEYKEHKCWNEIRKYLFCV